MKKAADEMARNVRQKQNSEAFSFKPMTSDKINQMEKERKAAEAKQKAEKETKIRRQEKLVKFLVFGGFVFVILYNLAKTAQSWARKEVSVDLKPEKTLVKCEKELLARNSCRKEVEDLCSALGIKATGDECKVKEDDYAACCETEGLPLQR